MPSSLVSVVSTPHYPLQRGGNRLVLRIQFFFELFLFTLATGLTSARRTAFIGIKINIVKIDLRIGITLGRLTGTTSTTIVAIGFHIVFWFEIIHLTPH